MLLPGIKVAGSLTLAIGSHQLSGQGVHLAVVLKTCTRLSARWSLHHCHRQRCCCLGLCHDIHLLLDPPVGCHNCPWRPAPWLLLRSRPGWQGCGRSACTGPGRLPPECTACHAGRCKAASLAHAHKLTQAQVCCNSRSAGLHGHGQHGYAPARRCSAIKDLPGGASEPQGVESRV